jgi:molecular chaperone HtpG
MSIETRKFDAEVGKVLNLMIHSLYTNKEIFMRELISNASDACDKLRYLAISNPELTKDDPEFKIEVSVDSTKRQTIIEDNGIGMDRQDLIDNLGTIAKSGTAQFMQALEEGKQKDSALIGQFGVGFYSVYMIAGNVKVISQKAGSQQGYCWQSEGLGEYSIEETSKLSRGTKIIISIKEGEDEFLDHFRLKNIIKTYSDHIQVPIYFEHNGTNTQVNSSSAIWARSKSEVSTEQYREFYQSIAHAGDDPWLVLHNKNEGAIEFTNLLFVPTNKTFDLFHPDRKRRVKLYIKKVFITDENIELVPRYLRFLRGVVDCDSLPLNVSRETLQHNPVVTKIQKSIVGKVLTQLEKQKNETPQEYERFWREFGSAMKEGLCEAIPDAEKLLDICLFYSVAENKMISLAQYVASLTPEQKQIYYLSGDNIEKLKSSPQIEGFRKQNIDVLLFTDTVDDFWVNVVSKYKDFEFKSVTRADIDLQQGQDTQDPESSSALAGYFKEVLGERVKDVRLSKRLDSIPSCLTVAEGAMDIRMERFLIEQKQLNSASAKILEINANHAIVAKIAADLEQNSTNQDTAELVQLVYDQACIIENEQLADPAEFCRRLNKFINLT